MNDKKITIERCGNIEVRLIFSSAHLSKEQIEKTILRSEIEKANSFGSSKRKEEFKRSRWLIRQFIQPTNPIIGGEHNLISWPEGLTASLSHKKDVIAFAFDNTDSVSSIGIDLEYLGGVKTNLAEKICCSSEINLLEKISTKTGVEFSKLLAVVFSFKEAVFKAVFPIGKIWFYFDDFAVEDLDTEHGKISGRLKKTTSFKTVENTIIEGDFILLDPLVRSEIPSDRKREAVTLHGNNEKGTRVVLTSCSIT